MTLVLSLVQLDVLAWCRVCRWSCAGGVSPVWRIGRGARRSGECRDGDRRRAGSRSGPVRSRSGGLLVGSARSRVLSARRAVLSVRSSWVSCSRSRILPMPVRLTPSATSSAIRRSRRRSSWLYRRVPPVVRAGLEQPVPLVQPQRADRHTGQFRGHRDGVHPGGGSRFAHLDHPQICAQCRSSAASLPSTL